MTAEARGKGILLFKVRKSLNIPYFNYLLGDVVRFEEAKLTSKGQITIPKSVRMQLVLKPGKSVLFIPEGRDVIIKPKVKDSLRDLERIRKELEEEGRLFTEKEIKQMIRESKREWSKVE